MIQSTLFAENITYGQFRWFKDDKLSSQLRELEDRYLLRDETQRFKKHVNFSTALATPYQRWVRYREGYSTELVVELLIRSGIDPSSYSVADPMMGSGTTLLAATRLGYDSLGLDMNPYATIMAEFKLLRPTASVLRSVWEASSKLASSLDKPQGPLNIPEIQRLEPYADYFSHENLRALRNLRAVIEQIGDPTARKICLASWFTILEECSNRKKDGNGLMTRPSPVKDVQDFYLNKLDQVVADYLHFPLPSGPVSQADTGTALEFYSHVQQFVKYSDKPLGAVVFSPPYANSFDYFESYKLELLMGGLLDPDEFVKHRKRMVRNYRIGYGKELQSEFELVELLCQAVWEAIPSKEEMTGKRDGRTRLVPNMLRGYFSDMCKVIGELYKSLISGGKCYIVVDQSSYVGVIIPTDLILAKIGEQIGFKVDYISKCRRALTSGQQLRLYPYLRGTLRESIVALTKP